MPRASRLYRVFPWIETAEPGAPGHPLYVSPPQGHGRVDNPEHYLVLYASDDPDGAIGESFGNHAKWTSDLLLGPPAVPGSQRALVTVDAAALDVVDLDDPSTLVERQLRPSRVVTRNRLVTQAWSLAIFQEGQWAGVRWWSFHNPDWGSFGLWDLTRLEVVDVKPLTDEVDRVRDVAEAMCRLWED